MRLNQAHRGLPQLQKHTDERYITSLAGQPPHVRPSQRCYGGSGGKRWTPGESGGQLIRVHSQWRDDIGTIEYVRLYVWGGFD